MTWGAVAGAAIGVIGGAMNASSASGAAATQAQAGVTASNNALLATQQTNQLNANMYQQGMINQAPYLSTGQEALSALSSGMGLGPAYNGALAPATNGNVVPGNGTVNGGMPAPVTGGMPSPSNPTPGTAQTMSVLNGANNPTMTTGGAPQAIPVGAPPTLTSATGTAVDAQGNPINSGQFANGIGNTNYGASNAQLASAAGSVTPGSLTSTFSPADLAAGIDPGYAFRLQQGNEALVAQEAAGGNRFGAQTLKDMSNYNQQAASQEYGAAFNRFQTNQSNVYNRLAALSGTGQTAANNATNAGLTTGQTLSSNTQAGTAASNNYLTGAAAASAAGQVGSTGALVGGINSGVNNAITMKYLNGVNSGYTPSQQVDYTNMSQSPFSAVGANGASSPNYG